MVETVVEDEVHVEEIDDSDYQFADTGGNPDVRTTDSDGAEREDPAPSEPARPAVAEVSVADVAGGPVPDVTRLEVADAEVIDAVRSVYEPLFGEIDVVEAAVRIDGIDIEVILGRTFLEEVRGELAADVAGSGGDDDGDASDE